MHSRVAFAIEQDQSIGLELEIGTDLGSRVAGWSGDLRACQSLRTATHPAFQRLSDLLRRRQFSELPTYSFESKALSCDLPCCRNTCEGLNSRLVTVRKGVNSYALVIVDERDGVAGS